MKPTMATHVVAFTSVKRTDQEFEQNFGRALSIANTESTLSGLQDPPN